MIHNQESHPAYPGYETNHVVGIFYTMHVCLTANNHMMWFEGMLQLKQYNVCRIRHQLPAIGYGMDCDHGYIARAVGWQNLGFV